MTHPSRLSAIEKSTQRHLNRPKALEYDFAKTFATLAASNEASVENIVSAASMLFEDFAKAAEACAQRTPEKVRGKFVHSVRILEDISNDPKILEKMPDGFGLVVADQLSAGLKHNLPKNTAGYLFNNARAAIYGNAFAKRVRPEHVAASLCKLAAVSVERPEHYLNIAELAVSDKLGLSNRVDVPMVVNAYAARANPVGVVSPSDRHVRALEIFAKNSEEFVGCYKEEAPALYETLIHFEDMITSIGYDTDSDGRTSQKRLGLVNGRDAMREIILFN